MVSNTKDEGSIPSAPVCPHKLTDRLTSYEPVNVGSISTEDIRSDSLMDKTTGFYPVFEGSSPSQSIKILKNTIYCIFFLKSLKFIQYIVFM